MATGERGAESVAARLVREQCYLLMMRPTEPPAEAPGSPDALRRAHHDYLVELERRGLLVAAGPCRDAEGWVRGTGLIIVRAPNRAEADAIAGEEPYTRAGLREIEVIPWQRNEGDLTLRLRLADGVLEIDNRRWAIGPAD